MCITMCSLVMSLFSRDYIETELIKCQQCFNLLTSVQYSHGAWFLDGGTSIPFYHSLLCMHIHRGGLRAIITASTYTTSFLMQFTI